MELINMMRNVYYYSTMMIAIGSGICYTIEQMHILEDEVSENNHDIKQEA